MKEDLIRRVEELSVELAEARKAIADQKRALERVGRDAERYTILRNVLWRGMVFSSERHQYEIDSAVVDSFGLRERQVWDDLAVGSHRV